jgi:Trk-type K+ transport system membrane component
MVRVKMPSLGPLNQPLRFIRRQLPPLNFITLHYTYFIGICLLFALIFWGSSTPRDAAPDHGTTLKVSFTDSLFLSVSAMTEAGLNTVNLSELNTFQQILLFILIILGSAIWVSAFVVQVRKRAFEKKFRIVVEEQNRRRREARSRSRERGLKKTWSLGRTSRSAETKAVGDATQAQNKGAGDAEDAEESNEKANHEDGSDKSNGKDKTEHGSDDAAMLDGNRDGAETPPERRGAPEMNGISSQSGNALDHVRSADSQSQHPGSPQPGITFRDDTRFASPPSPRMQSPYTTRTHRRRGSLFSVDGVGARPNSSLEISSPVHITIADDAARGRPTSARDAPKTISTKGWVSRNSQFHGLTERERIELGGYEYQAVTFLAWLVPAYFIAWQLIGCIGCGAWIAINNPSSARTNGLNPWWVGAFNAVSAFNNSGMSLLDANMTAYQRSYYLLITMGLLILAGNTAYPIFLRFFVWCMWKVISSEIFLRRINGEHWEERAQVLRFLLDHPRRCYTNLFPAQHTWWLLFALIMLNGIDWAGFEILNINNEALYSGLPERYRVIDGLFQAFAVRSGGFYVVTISNLRISLQVLYVVMMYISVYPVVITMRHSNVYEERSLGIYAEEIEEEEDEKKKKDGPGILSRALTLGDHMLTGGARLAGKESNSHFVQHQLRAQLAHDAWVIVLALFLIMIIENTKFDNDPSVFSVFNFLFEIVSGYGCVGISVGVPWANYSFCGTWQKLSKLILCFVMLKGRHRGLPVAIDKAVLLPGERDGWAEEEDGLRRRLSRATTRARQDEEAGTVLGMAEEMNVGPYGREGLGVREREREEVFGREGW